MSNWESEKNYAQGPWRPPIVEGNEACTRDYEHWKKTGRHLDDWGREKCFVATAVYGSYDAPEVMKLRQFRDEVLRKTSTGRTFITWYYRYGPYLARVVKHSSVLTHFSRACLDGFIQRFLTKK
jgi:hypothetical protein